MVGICGRLCGQDFVNAEVRLAREGGINGEGRERGARAFAMLPEGGFCVRVCDVNLNVNSVRVMFRFLVTGCYDGL